MSVSNHALHVELSDVTITYDNVTSQLYVIMRSKITVTSHNIMCSKSIVTSHTETPNKLSTLSLTLILTTILTSILTPILTLIHRFMCGCSPIKQHVCNASHRLFTMYDFVMNHWTTQVFLCHALFVKKQCFVMYCF